ncbi:zinc finger protein 551-like isoform X2 [Thalassophryne amazonica]|uniref:zinc finger protein 551-like isoform X2 n=1 Tax=Thalassophryne amazonica TaxID=390379 RepID=UPI001471B519|nr:zinc finger protein 551-like isoform X2 [Thalassophryne amazonica]
MKRILYSKRKQTLGFSFPLADKEESSVDDIRIMLTLREHAAFTVDCVKMLTRQSSTLDGLPAADQSGRTIKVEFKAEEVHLEEDRSSTHGLMKVLPIQCQRDIVDECSLVESLKAAAKCDESQTDELRALQLNRAATDQKLFMFQNDDTMHDKVWRMQNDGETSTFGYDSADKCDPGSSVMTSEQRKTGAETQEEAGDVKAAEPATGVVLPDVGSTIGNVAEKNLDEDASKPTHLPCERCGKSFLRRSSLLRHKRYHCCSGAEDSVDLSYTCNICSLMFRTERHLKLHACCDNGQQSEQKERIRQHACTQCNKGFYQFSTLQQHLIIHSGEKPYSCKVCGKTFGREGTLKEHQVTHSGEKPFHCEHCGKRCARKGDLKIHLLSHSEERPYSCSFCSSKWPN